MRKEVVEFTVGADGKLKIETQDGFKGPKCENELRSLLRGVPLDDEKVERKAGYYESPGEGHIVGKN